MIVVVIIGILAAIAIPNFQGVSESAKQSACRSNQRFVIEGINMYVADNGLSQNFMAGYTDNFPGDYMPKGMECQTANSGYIYVIIKNGTSHRDYAYGASGLCRMNHGYIWNSRFINWD